MINNICESTKYTRECDVVYYNVYTEFIGLDA